MIVFFRVFCVEFRVFRVEKMLKTIFGSKVCHSQNIDIIELKTIF